MIRWAFAKGGNEMKAALAPHVPEGVSERLNLQYLPGDDDAYLDVYYPAALEGNGASLPMIVWVHGGSWIAGSRTEVSNYAKILAARGFVVACVDYSLAPGSTYPTPIRQVNAALDYLERESARLHIDPSRIVLAGDSAGAQIASQMGTLISAPGYAREVGVDPAIERTQLKGVILYCGPYDLGAVDFSGSHGGFLRTVCWSYSGTRDFLHDARFAQISVTNYVTSDFPPAFISSGNADPLTSQSKALAARLSELGVRVDTLFFADDHQPLLPHEYQFNLDQEAGRAALERSTSFLSSVVPNT